MSAPALSGPGRGETPQAWIARVDGAAERLETPCGAGRMVWRSWGEGEPLVLLHGGSGSWLHWIRNLPALAARYRVVAPDTPGLGDSHAPPRPFDPERLAESIDGIAEVVCRGLAEVVPSPAHYGLVGFSMGAILGGYVAARERHRVRSCTVVGASALGVPWPGLSGPLRSLEPGMDEADAREVHTHNLGVILLSDRVGVDEAALAVQSHNVERNRMPTHWLARSDVLARILPQVRAPLAGIWGGRDVYAPRVETCLEVLLASHPQARLRVIPDAGHWVMFERAEAFDRALLELLGEEPGS